MKFRFLGLLGIALTLLFCNLNTSCSDSINDNYSIPDGCDLEKGQAFGKEIFTSEEFGLIGEQKNDLFGLIDFIRVKKEGVGVRLKIKEFKVEKKQGACFLEKDTPIRIIFEDGSKIESLSSFSCASAMESYQTEQMKSLNIVMFISSSENICFFTNSNFDKLKERIISSIEIDLSTKTQKFKLDERTDKMKIQGIAICLN